MPMYSFTMRNEHKRGRGSSLGIRLRVARLTMNGMTQPELAKAMNDPRVQPTDLRQPTADEREEVTKGAISQWETGRTNPDLARIAAAAAVLKVSLDYLVFGMHGTLEARIEALPDNLRDGVQKKVRDVIESAERHAKELETSPAPRPQTVPRAIKSRTPHR